VRAESFNLKAKPILPHRHAIEDADDVIDCYREHAGTLISQNFASEVDEAYACLSRHPNIGSPRTALDLDIEGIKSWSLKRFPHQIYYRVLDDRIELCRVLHPKRKITQAMLARQRFQ
jgi:toxin ParE1/3/4